MAEPGTPAPDSGPGGPASGLREALAALERQGLKRQRRILDGGQGAHARVDGADLLSFASNDYLGLANHPELVVAA
ncbi:MAG: hypothetical protein MUC79_15190, partial [Thiobacillaceae bacterium]|nr:hypothetical protein [Thiobacillaceae bacterium]